MLRRVVSAQKRRIGRQMCSVVAGLGKETQEQMIQKLQMNEEKKNLPAISQQIEKAWETFGESEDAADFLSYVEAQATRIFVQKGQPQLAIQLFQTLPERSNNNHFVPSRQQYSFLTGAFEATEEYDRVSEVYHQAINNGRRPTVSMNASLLRTLFHRGQYQLILDVFKELNDKNEPLNAHVYSPVFWACQKLGQRDLIKEYVFDLQVKGWTLSESQYSNIFSTFLSPVGSTESNNDDGQPLSRGDYDFLLSMYNEFLPEYMERLDSGRAELKRKKHPKSFKKPFIPYNELILVASRRSDFLQVISFYKDIQILGIAIPHARIKDIINAFVSNNQLEEAFDVIKRVYIHRFDQPNIDVIYSLINYASINQNTDLVIGIMKLLSDMEVKKPFRKSLKRSIFTALFSSDGCEEKQNLSLMNVFVKWSGFFQLCHADTKIAIDVALKLSNHNRLCEICKIVEIFHESSEMSFKEYNEILDMNSIEQLIIGLGKYQDSTHIIQLYRILLENAKSELDPGVGEQIMIAFMDKKKPADALSVFGKIREPINTSITLKANECHELIR